LREPLFNGGRGEKEEAVQNYEEKQKEGVGGKKKYVFTFNYTGKKKALCSQYTAPLKENVKGGGGKKGQL